MPLSAAPADRLARALLSLEGLSVADAFGDQLLRAGQLARQYAVGERLAPSGSWPWTDDTAMAISIVEILARHDGIEPAALAAAFAARHALEPARGYGGGAHLVLEAIHEGTPYEQAARRLFDGAGSCGNGGGMRAAPIGAYFADDLDAVVAHAIHSAAPTHSHPDGIAGAVAIAVAAAATTAGARDPHTILELAIAHTPPGPTLDGLRRAHPLVGTDPVHAATVLGNGSRILASDTIPFAVWCAATHLTDYTSALWACALVGGDVDTTCAMVGGILAPALGLSSIPLAWRTAREPLPATVRLPD